MGKRADNEGTVYQRSNGRWVAELTLPDGKRKTLYGKDQKDALAKLKTARRTLDAGLPVLSDKLTVRTYLTDWLAAVRDTLKPRTHLRYSQLIRLHALPTLGKLPLAKLTPQDLRRLYSALQADGGLSPTTVRQLHAILHHALEQAMRDGTLGRNVADLVSPPRAATHQMQTLAPEQARALLAAAAGNRLEALYVLALSTGMRQGELLALHWSDCDLDAASLNVRGTLARTEAGLTIESPKTAVSRRRITLTTAAVAALRKHRLAQTEERLKLGSDWTDSGLVFANEVGKPIEAGNLLRRSFWPLLTQAELPKIRFHDLRHSAATLLLGKGVHPKIVSEMLGHSKVGITLDLYSHVTQTMQQEAAAAMDSVLSG